MKKRFVLFIFALFITFSTYGQNSLYEGSGGKNHTIMFANSILENGVFDQSDEMSIVIYSNRDPCIIIIPFFFCDLSFSII